MLSASINPNRSPLRRRCLQFGRARRRSLTLLIGALLAAHAAAGDDSLAKEAPADAGLFVELRNSADLLAGLLDPQLWSTLAEIAGQPARVEDVADWRKQIENAIHIEPLKAIQTLFARRVAFVGDGIGKSQDGVVICRPVEPPARLIEQFKGTRLVDIPTPPTYHLYNTIGVIEHDDLLFFGALLPEDSLLHRMRPIIAGEPRPRLAEDPVYRGLLARVPADPDGVFFARIPGRAHPPRPAHAVATAPAGAPPAAARTARPRLDLPGPLENAENILLALYREGSRLHFSAVGDRAGGAPAPASRPASPVLITGMPDESLAAWEGHVDFSAFAGATTTLPERGLLRALLGQDSDGRLIRQWTQTLDGSVCVAVGTVAPPRPGDPPPFPAVAFVLGSRDAQASAEAFGKMVTAALGLINVAQLARGAPAIEPPSQSPLGDGTLWRLDLSPAIARIDGGAIGELHLAWTTSKNRLIVASHSDWLKKVVETPPGLSLAATLDHSKEKLSPATSNRVLLRLGPLARLGEQWIAYFQRVAPESLTDAWWRAHQPRGAPRLGCEVVTNDGNNHLTVTMIFPGQAAEGRLQTGDQIVGANAKRFATTQPIAEARDAISQRPHGEYIELMVERDGKARSERIPLAYVDPIRSLRRLIAIGSMINLAIYFEDDQQAEGPRGFLTLDLGAPPPGSPPQPAPASQPAGSPPVASQPVAPPPAAPASAPGG